MKNNLCFPSYTEFIQKSEMIKHRQERLIQVRQREKELAAEFLDKMKDQAQRQYENTEKYIMNEICELHCKELAAMRRVYEECIMKINQEHYTKAMQSKANQNYTNVFPSNSERNLLFKKNLSPVKTIVICEESRTTANKDRREQGLENYERKQQERNPSPVKKTCITRVTNEDQVNVTKKTSNPLRVEKRVHNKMENRTTSIYHEKCVPDLERNTSPKKKSFSVKSIQTTPNLILVNENQINKVTNPTLRSFLKKSTEDFLNSYTQRVHDRIRILEQKEKMLERRAIFLPEFNHPTIAQRKRDCATNTDYKVTIEEHKTTELQEQTSKQDPPNKGGQVDSIPKQVRNTAVQTSRSCRTKKRHCKQASLTKNEDMIIFIRNHQNETSNVIECNAPRDIIIEQTSTNASRETDSSVSDSGKMSLSVKKIVHAPVNDYVQHPQIKKLKNWRKLFNNGEKLSESSYYSPPDPSKNAFAIPVKSKKKKCKRHLLRDRADSEDEKDIGYYVAKLLLMSPESLENLNNISCETVSSISVDEMEYDKPTYARSTADSEESIDEEEFIRRVLEVSIPKHQATESNVILRNETGPSPEKSRVSSSSEKSSVIDETDVRSKTSSITASEDGDTKQSKPTTQNDVLKDVTVSDLKLDSTLSGWIGASIRRTLEASAINSTSSYDESDNLRQVNQLVRSLIEQNEYSLASGSSSSSSTRFSFSPVVVPEIHLNVPQISGSST